MFFFVFVFGCLIYFAPGRGNVEIEDLHKVEKIDTVSNIIQCDAGDSHTLLLDIDGNVWMAGMYKTSEHKNWKDISDQTWDELSTKYKINSSDDEEKRESKIISLRKSLVGSNKFFGPVSFLKRKVVKIAAGYNCNAALTEDGDLVTCTYNLYNYIVFILSRLPFSSLSVYVVQGV
jgi:alpha-tubulin suppressor-like RCC1 family protein